MFQQTFLGIRIVLKVLLLLVIIFSYILIENIFPYFIYRYMISVVYNAHGYSRFITFIFESQIKILLLLL